MPNPATNRSTATHLRPMVHLPRHNDENLQQRPITSPQPESWFKAVPLGPSIRLGRARLLHRPGLTQEANPQDNEPDPDDTPRRQPENAAERQGAASVGLGGPQDGQIGEA